MKAKRASAPANKPPVVLAAAAHPDDIEFMMAGTLLALQRAGAQIHMWNLANGHCGTMRHSRAAIIRQRRREALDSARVAGAVAHAPLFDDLAVFYDGPSLARVAAVVRQIRPTVILTHAPFDYMEDHQNTCRLIVTAAFGRGMKNFRTRPPRPAFPDAVAVYHAMPHGLRDGLGRILPPDRFVNIASTLDVKRDMLARHRSQKEWLDASQGMGAYLHEMEALCRQMGRMSRRFRYAEGWRAHNMLGFGPAGFDPMKDMLKGDCHATTAE